MPWIIGGAVLGSALLGADAASNASDAASQVASNSTQLERAKFEEAKRQADLLRQRGDEAAAAQIENGAEYQALAAKYANAADTAAATKQADATAIYQKIQQAAAARQKAGDNAVDAIRGAIADVKNAAGLNEQQMQAALATATGQVNSATSAAQAGLKTAFDNTASRFSPFITSEKNAIGQLDAEMGLGAGTQYKGYQNSPAYMAAQDASKVAEQEGINTINTAAGNAGDLYSGSRGAALVDRSKQGSYERAQLEQSYYQNYMNMLTQMANPTATTYVSNAEQQTARDSGNIGLDSAKYLAGLDVNTAQSIGQTNMNAAGSALNATNAGANLYLNSRSTGAEGADLLNYLDPGTAGAQYALSGVANNGVVNAANTRLNTQGTAGGLITGNMPTGTQANNAILAGAEAQNAALADVGGAVTSGVSNYLKYGTPTNGSYNYAPSPQTNPNLYQPIQSPYISNYSGVA